MSVERTMAEPVTLQQNKESDESWLVRSASSSSSSSNSSDISQPGSLNSSIDSRYSQSMESDTSERRYAIEELMGTVLVDYNGQVCVKSSKPGSGIHVGDRILAIDAKNKLDARAMAEYIRGADCEKVSLRISHGVRCAISTQERGFQMNLRGGDLVQCDVHDVVRTVCHLACTTNGGQSSTLSVTDPANFPEETDVRKVVVEDEVQEILQETPTVIHLQPECLRRALDQLKGICIGQGLGSSGEVVTGSDQSSPGSGNRGGPIITPKTPVDSQIIPARNKSSSSPDVEGPTAAAPEDSSSSSSTDSTKVILRNHGNKSRSPKRPLGKVFTDVE
ncbi:uncharacterized protein LOC105436554 [Strongylocentrotus purpuratus]|uniref:PDZ domain-containing protein n=1 Tax=Strongylocentrotus purpuratus TaxID=7668 RepID=A0A7M7NUT7_STRPU|nr:uncharacterized protein LOC105436554 [Strongylocentrotus purpuratus]